MKSDQLTFLKRKVPWLNYIDQATVGMDLTDVQHKTRFGELALTFGEQNNFLDFPGKNSNGFSWKPSGSVLEHFCVFC